MGSIDMDIKAPRGVRDILPGESWKCRTATRPRAFRFGTLDIEWQCTELCPVRSPPSGSVSSEKYYNMHLENKFKKGAYFSQVFDKPIDQVTDFKDLDFIIYAFAEPTDTGYINPLKKENQAKDLITKAHANGVACFISFGGKYSYYDFCEIGKDENKTNFFTENVVDLCKKYGFDGVDIDWESPIPSDTEACNRLFKSLSTACKENKLYFTAAPQ